MDKYWPMSKLRLGSVSSGFFFYDVFAKGLIASNYELQQPANNDQKYQVDR